VTVVVRATRQTRYKHDTYMSLLTVNLRSSSDSGAIHLTGTRPYNSNNILHLSMAKHHQQSTYLPNCCRNINLFFTFLSLFLDHGGGIITSTNSEVWLWSYKSNRTDK